MKKFIASVLVGLLTLALFCTQGFAVYGDVTVRDAEAFADASLTQYLGTIPRYTALVVRDADSNVAEVNVNGVDCYMKPSSLSNSRFDYLYKGYSTLKRGAAVYQRPTTSSRSIDNGRARTVLVVGVKGDWVLIRSNFGGYFGFVRRSGLSGFTPAG